MVFLGALRAMKATTGLTGLAVHPDGPGALRMLYGKILKVLDKMPAEAAYRKYTAAIIGERLELINHHAADLETLEAKINCGQVEELVSQAEKELNLARKMVKWQPWQPLVEEAPPSQWKWPLF
jgi:NADH dehydrogenase (ubiquinone) 1 alpha subcomplex subunit 5